MLVKGAVFFYIEAFGEKICWIEYLKTEDIQQIRYEYFCVGHTIHINENDVYENLQAL